VANRKGDLAAVSSVQLTLRYLRHITPHCKAGRATLRRVGCRRFSHIGIHRDGDILIAVKQAKLQRNGMYAVNNAFFIC